MKNNKALFLSMFLMLPFPILTSEIEEINNRRNPPNDLINHLDNNTNLRLNTKEDKTELI